MDKMQNQKISFEELLEIEKDASSLQLYQKKFYAFCQKYCDVKAPEEKVADLDTWMEEWFADWKNHAEDITNYFDHKELFDKNATEEYKKVYKRYQNLEVREMFDMHYWRDME